MGALGSPGQAGKVGATVGNFVYNRMLLRLLETCTILMILF